MSMSNTEKTVKDIRQYWQVSCPKLIESEDEGTDKLNCRYW